MPVRRRLNPAFSPRRPGESIAAEFTGDTSGFDRDDDIEIGQPEQVSPPASTGFAAAPPVPKRPSVSQPTRGETSEIRTRTRPRERAPVQPRRPVERRPQEPEPSVPTPTVSQQPDSTGSQPTSEGRPSPSLVPPPTSPVTAADRISVPMRAMEPEPTGSQPGSDGAQRPTPSISSASEPLTAVVRPPTDVSVAPPRMPIAQQAPSAAAPPDTIPAAPPADRPAAPFVAPPAARPTAPPAAPPAATSIAPSAAPSIAPPAAPPAAPSAVRPSLGPASANLFGSAGGLGGGGIGIPGSARAEGGEPTELLLELSKLLRRRGTGAM